MGWRSPWAAAALVFAVKPDAGWIAVPFCGLWMLAPVIARWVSLPASEPASEQLSDADIESLRLTARRTWLFFETFVGPEDNGLPPDNFQDDPTPVVAHRTSPTNIGVYLLSTVTARDFGWIGTHEMVERLETTLATINRLERFRGHLYNWYDTRDLRRLDPAVRVVGRQRQSRRPPPHARQRLSPDDRPTASGRGRARRDR